MARTSKIAAMVGSHTFSHGLTSWAETLGEALGRGVARGINTGLTTTPSPTGTSYLARRGRPPKMSAMLAGKRCRINGCTNSSRSKGLCSKHYQAERRRMLGKAKA